MYPTDSGPWEVFQSRDVSSSTRIWTEVVPLPSIAKGGGIEVVRGLHISEKRRWRAKPACETDGREPMRYRRTGSIHLVLHAADCPRRNFPCYVGNRLGRVRILRVRLLFLELVFKACTGDSSQPGSDRRRSISARNREDHHWCSEKRRLEIDWRERTRAPARKPVRFDTGSAREDLRSPFHNEVSDRSQRRAQLSS